MKRFYYLLVVFLTLNMQANGQDEDKDMWDLSLEELMNIEIVSASKKAESSFKSPLSSTVLTKDEIIASGATTIEEALRLAPGMMVREETNGNFDAHIRGNDNLPPGNFMMFSENTMTLVMIDGRPVYNYSNGGTFWESLPISLVDIDRIEIVRGPATALYGPNAVTGAINIITRQVSDQKISVHGNATIGNKNTSIVDLSVGTSLLDNKMKLRVSGNLENRDRDQDTYYAFALGQYVPIENVPDYATGELIVPYENTRKAKERKGLNAFVNYDVNDKVSFQLASGLQDSYANATFTETRETPLSNRTVESKYVDARAQIHGLHAQFSLNNGTQNVLAGTSSQNSIMDFKIQNAVVEYDFDLGKIILRPGLNYQEATYRDLDYVENEGAGYLNGAETLSNIGYFLRADYKPTDKLRLIAAIRNDQYNVPDDSYLSYQFVGSYNFNENHLLRAVYSKANRGPFMVDSFINYSTGDGFNSPKVHFLGSDSLDLPVMKMIELGYRGVLTQMVTLEIELFHTITSNITSFDATDLSFDFQDGLQIFFNYQNLDLIARQTGATFSLNVAPSSKVQLKAYATIQQTQLEDYDKKLTPVIIDPASFTFELPVIERINTVHKQTPSIFGGLTGNFIPQEKFNLFAGLYYMSKHTYRHDYASYEESKGEIEVPGRAVVNLKASYNVYKNNSLFINARNVFNTKGQEFGFADEIGGLYLAGISLSF